MPTGPGLCPIAQLNELANVRVLVESFRALHPGKRCLLLLLDDREENIDGAGEFEVIRPQDLEVERFEHLAALLAPRALRSAARAWLLRALWRRDKRSL